VALLVALTGGARRADQQGSLVAVAGFPLGRVLLIGCIAFLGAYALWGFIRAVYDPLDEGNDAKGIAARLAFAFSGCAYVALTLFAIGLLTHGSGGNHPDQVQQWAGRVLAAPRLTVQVAGAPLRVAPAAPRLPEPVGEARMRDRLAALTPAGTASPGAAADPWRPILPGATNDVRSVRSCQYQCHGDRSKTRQ